MINDVNIFTLNEPFILKIIKNLPAIYQNKTKVLGKVANYELSYKKR